MGNALAAWAGGIISVGIAIAAGAVGCQACFKRQDNNRLETEKDDKTKEMLEDAKEDEQLQEQRERARRRHGQERGEEDTKERMNAMNGERGRRRRWVRTVVRSQPSSSASGAGTLGAGADADK